MGTANSCLLELAGLHANPDEEVDAKMSYEGSQQRKLIERLPNPFIQVGGIALVKLA
jgi:hypothetical protein